MSRLKHLTGLANQFYVKATSAQDVQLQQYFSRMIREMIGLARGAEVSVKHLISLPKYGQSAGLQAMSQQLPELISAITGISPQEPAPGLNKAGEILNALSFYTSTNNAGTGYDPMTAARESGYSAPAYYIGTLTSMINQMKRQLPAGQGNPFTPNSEAIALNQ